MAIAVIFAVFAFSFVYAVIDEPEWNDYCKEMTGPRAGVPVEKTSINQEDCPNITYPTSDEETLCTEQKGQLQLKYGYDNCPVKYICETCQNDYDLARSEYNFIVFLMACGFALLAIILGITTPGIKGEFAEIISPGFIVGGLITLFTGTGMYYGDMGKIIRPIVMFVELVVVLYLIYWAIKKKK